MTATPTHVPNRSGVLRIMFAGAMASVMCMLLALGVWQVQRLAWKEALLAQIDVRMQAAPVAAPSPRSRPALDLANADYTRVVLPGRFMPGDVYYYASLSKPRGRYGGPGFFVYSLFLADAGWAVLVNRGFVPARTDVFVPRSYAPPPDGAYVLNGILRRPETPNFLIAEADLEASVWFARVPEEMAGHLLSSSPSAEMRIAPYTIDMESDPAPPDAPLPQPGETIVSLPNNHLGYAVTWFGLAAVTAVMTLFYLRARPVAA